MQDKEFDELFRSKLEGLEVEPRKGLWDNIAAEVVINKKNRSALPFISIAASILVFITAGLLFVPKLQVKGTKLAQNPTVANIKQPKVMIAPAKNNATSNSDSQPKQIVAVAEAPKDHSMRPHVKKQDNSLPALKIENMQPLEQIARIEPETNNTVLVAVTPDVNAPVTLPQVNDQIKMIPAATLLAQQIPVKTIAAVQPRKHRINSFGDLINVVVSKVDKRKDKLIEFSNRDDDESLITGVNLGIVRVKKEEVIATNK